LTVNEIDCETRGVDPVKEAINNILYTSSFDLLDVLIVTNPPDKENIPSAAPLGSFAKE
jgi:hypothetical protein